MLNQESIESGRNVPRTKPPIVPGKFPYSRLDVNEIPGHDDIFHHVSDEVSGSRTPSFFILTEGEIQVPIQNDITLKISSFFTEKIPAIYFFTIGVRSVDVKNTYHGVGVFLIQHGEDPVGADFDVLNFVFTIVPEGSYTPGSSPRA